MLTQLLLRAAICLVIVSTGLAYGPENTSAADSHLNRDTAYTSAPSTNKHGTTSATNKYMTWFKDALRKARDYYNAHPEEIPQSSTVDIMAVQQPEYIECMKYDERFGVKDFDQEFKQNWKIEGESRCFSIVRRVKSGELKIVVPNWSQDYDSIFNRRSSKNAYLRRRLASTNLSVLRILTRHALMGVI